ncbi:MAG: DUF3800 domain-containing protein [Terriglobales bacterium]
MSYRESQYDAYRHVSEMLDRARVEWWLAMFEIELYFDDSGTDGGTPVAVAACYVAQKSQWDEFVRNWDEVMAAEGFDMFHMAEFVAKPEMKHEPFCHWDNPKKDRVYARLASIINTRVRKGFAVAVPKQPFDEYIFDEFREYAQNHYVWAVKSLMGFIDNWRQQFSITVPMQYVFESGSLGQEQIEGVWKECLLRKDSERRYGIVPNGVMFQDKRLFKPLQAADILAWQMQNNMRRTVMIGRDSNDRRLVHPGFRMLRDGRPMELAFYSRDQVRMTFERTKAYHAEHGIWPWEPETGAYWRVVPAEPGAV